MQLEGTSACIMRDELIKQRSQKKITLSEITNRLIAIDIPEFLQSQILQMVKHNWNKRITCPVELAMEKAVHYKILDELLKEKKKLVSR